MHATSAGYGDRQDKVESSTCSESWYFWSFLSILEEPGILFVFEFASLVSLSSLRLSFVISFPYQIVLAMLYRGFVSVHTSRRSLD